MAKVTSKLQLTLPKKLADQYGIKPGDEVAFKAGGNIIHLIPAHRVVHDELSPEERVRLFDDTNRRVREAQKHLKLPAEAPKDRGWTREDLYDRDTKAD